MRLIVTQNITLDGVIDATEGWFEPGNGDDQGDVLEIMRADMAREDAMLLGRRTFEDFRGYWPAQKDDTTGITAALNAVPKHVVSTTMTDPEWEHSVIERDLLGAARRLRDAPGAECVVTGSMSLLDPLFAEGLVDEVRLFVHPVWLGRGRRLTSVRVSFETLETRGLRSGVTYSRLRPK